jgi:hypothetical protein
MLPANRYVIRLATEHDGADLRRLAELDSARPLTGRILIGELDGVPAAALSLKTSRAIADPFKPTAALVDLLETRAALLRGELRRPRLRRLLTKGLAAAA